MDPAETETQPSQWSPPEFDLVKPPELQETYTVQVDKDFSGNFARCGKWNADGSAFLLTCENRTFQIHETPTLSLYNGHPGYQPITQTPDATSRVLTQPNAILDSVWYPTATCFDPSTYCLVTSVRECPVKLLDATTGRLRASYSIVDHRERQIAPHSMAFGGGGQRLYCGFEDAIELFDVARPGEGTRIMTTPSKKSRDGLKGIISALAFAPNQGSDFFAAGTFTQRDSNIALFDESQGEGPIMYVAGGPPASVMQLQFNPAKPYLVYAAYRRHQLIYCWDLRSSVDGPITVYQSEAFADQTNQKLKFDIDLSGRRLVVGNQGGTLSLFDMEKEDDSSASHATTADLHVLPTLTFPAHKDAIGSSAFHPTQQLLLTTSGSRHFVSNSDSESSDDSSEEREERLFSRPKQRPQPVPLDSSIRLWSFKS